MKDKIHDIIIIGGGPAGLTAGLYASRARMNTLLIESQSIIGQATMTDMIENYPGIERTDGFGLVSKIKDQAKAFGLNCGEGTVDKLSSREEQGNTVWQVHSDSGIQESFSVIVASGASPKKLEVPGEVELCGKGVSYCATCDAAFFRDKDIVVVGGGDTAVEEAIFLTKFGKKVTVIHRRDRLRAVKILQERAFSNEKIDFLWDSVVKSIEGSDKVERLRIKNVKTGENREVSCDGVFIFTGWQPNTDFLKGVLELDKKNSVTVDREMKTAQKGIFAAGDCCKRPLHQVITACGDGAVAAYSAQQYVEELKGIAYPKG